MLRFHGTNICYASNKKLFSSLTGSKFQGLWKGCPAGGRNSFPIKISSRSVNVDNYTKTMVNFLHHERNAALMINGISNVGFVLNNGMGVLGAIALFPRSVLSWRVFSTQDINEDTLSLFYILEPKIDILVLGTGLPGTQVDMKYIRFLREKNIAVEVLPTEKAISTYNFMVSEKRFVAAGLIPPAKLKSEKDDDGEKIRIHSLLEGKLRHIKEFKDDEDVALLKDPKMKKP